MCMSNPCPILVGFSHQLWPSESDDFQCFCICRASSFKVRALALSYHHHHLSGCQEQPRDLRHVLTPEILLYLYKEKGYGGCYAHWGITIMQYLQRKAWKENIMKCNHPVELNCHLTLFQVNYINPTLSYMNLLRSLSNETVSCAGWTAWHTVENYLYLSKQMSNLDWVISTSLVKYYYSSLFYC